MTRLTCVLREIRHRRLHFALGVLAVAVAVAGVAAAYALLAAFDHDTSRTLAEKEQAANDEMRTLEDEMRKITKRLGFNVVILPKDQNLADFYADDYASKTMPEEYVERLAKSGLMIIQHLLPTIQRKLKWDEQQRTIVLVGVRGEVPYAGNNVKDPILQPVPDGTVVLGYELHAAAGIKPGDKIAILGRQFTVHNVNPERGTKDDITAWIPLHQAQEMLGLQGKINSILALQCRCDPGDLPLIRKEITGVLPDTQVIEFASQAIARAEARNQAADTAVNVVEQWKTSRARVRAKIEGLVGTLAPLLVAVSLAAVALLSFLNARERETEIGILRALGFTGGDVLFILLGKAFVTGLVGGLAGAALARFAVPLFPGAANAPTATLFPLHLFVALLVAAPLMALFATWIPAQIAAARDPATILQREF